MPWDEKCGKSDPLVEAIATTTTDTPPPPPVGALNEWQTLPPGWTTAFSPTDGRIYCWEKATGKTSWSHPLASTGDLPVVQHQPLDTGGFHRSELLDTPRNAVHRPNNHQCYAVAALLLCLPVGVCAVYQSVMVDRAWSQGRYGDAVNHSRQASQYACFGAVAGAAFWIWLIFFEELVRMAEWFEFE